jgi:homoserine kinase type II
MSVYTKVTASELESFLRRYTVGALRDHAGIAEGIENTNYFVTTDQGRFVLTLFEQTGAEELPYCLDLMAFLAEHAIPSAHPLADGAGEYLQHLKGRPAVLVRRLNGASIARPGRDHCRVIGSTIGRMHKVGLTYHATRENERGVVWHANTAMTIRGRLNPADRALLDAELDHRRRFDFDRLPQGVIHADLFRDNVLFEGHTLTGLIDFYYAHRGPLIYDLAVTVSDWCFAADGFDADRAAAMVRAYAAQRPVAAMEIDAWLDCLRAAGLRFWLSRLRDQIFPRGGEITHIKDPGPFKAVLQACHRQAHELQSVWDRSPLVDDGLKS